MNLDPSTSFDGAASSASAAVAPAADPPASPGHGATPAKTFEPGPNHEARLAEVRLALEEKRNPFLEAARVLLRTLAELPPDLDEEALRGLHRLLTNELHSFTRLCEQANLRRDHMLAVRYTLCTALDESISLKSLASGEAGSPGIWSTLALLNQFHGENQGGRTVFLLIGRMANAPDEHQPVLEVIHHVLCLGFMGDYRVQNDGHRLLESIRHRLYTMVSAGREPVARELSPRWQGAGPGRFRLLRSVPVWVSASVLGLALFGQFSWYKYQLLLATSEARQRIESLALPPQAVAPRSTQDLNLTQLLSAEIAEGRVKVQETAERAVVTFRGEGMFSGGLDQLSDATRATLDKVAGALRQVGGAVNVIGHADNQPIATPAFPNNLVLSQKRAQSVLQALLGAGVEGRRLKAVGKGDTVPAASNATPAGRAANRRVDIEVVNEQPQE